MLSADDSDDTAEDDREDEEDARARELVGYVDLRETPFDVHAELKISKDNVNCGRARAGVSSVAIKWCPITRRRRRAGRVERAGACCSLSDGFVRDRRRIM